MAIENDRKTSSSPSHPPPPFDPFPTYQTPFPRNPNDDENPFIQFRRFADDQFHHFFSGIPHLFGFSASDSFRKEFEDVMKKRHEMEEGWRKQFEQDMEEVRHSFQNEREESQKSLQQKPWWLRGRAAECPALNGDDTSPKALKCLTLFDKAGNPRTELDAYEESGQIKSTIPASQHTQRRGWLSGIGCDGKRRQDQTHNAMDEAEKEMKNSSPQDPISWQASKYTRFNARFMDPVSNTDHIVPWIVLNPYSPVYLCNPDQPRIFKVRVQDDEGVPLQIRRPRFWRERNPSQLDHKMAKQLPWADAFEDLVSLQQTGQMVERDYSTFRTPNTWIHDMAHRGSLGPRWGFNEDGHLTKMPHTKMPQQETITEVMEPTGWDDPVTAIETASDGERKRKEAFVKGLVDGMEEVERVFPFITPALRQIWHNPDEIISAVPKAEQETISAITAAEKDAEADQALKRVLLPLAEVQEDIDTSQHSNVQNSWPTSSSSFQSSIEGSSDISDTVVSSLTRTESRTLPDGSTETRRVLKKKFADGREEREEAVDIQQPPGYTHNHAKKYQHPNTMMDSYTLTPTPVQDELKKQRKGGWFWN